ncbi:hypothetical protein [Sediminibacterium sp. C3]|uniref:hypothetical protein n=1 Tax=Sediminibacterium sp. C3 TaxID=1267211 RepID=UPI00041F5526|nr:hypothetical protein [Sediminibacterium sp. C3]
MKKSLIVFILLFPSVVFQMEGNLEATSSFSFMPVLSPVESQPLARDEDLMHGAILLSERVIINLYSSEISVPYDSLQSFIQKNASLINRESFCIAVAKEVDYKEVIRVVDAMATSNIGNYTLMRYD